MINKIIVLIITRLIELAIVGYGSYWLWTNMSNGLKPWVVFSLLLAYAFYLGVTLSNDYKEVRLGEGEPMM